MLAGHLDTVPLNDNLPSRLDAEAGLLHGLGTCDMKGGDAVILRLAATVAAPSHDVTYVLYEAEEIEATFNGLRLLSASDPELLAADFAILMEPSNGVVEAGCQGTLRVEVRTRGERSHSARSWRGVNAIHGAAEVFAQKARQLSGGRFEVVRDQPIYAGVLIDTSASHSGTSCPPPPKTSLA